MKRRTLLLIYIVLILIAIAGLLFEIHLCKAKINSKQIAYHRESNISYITYLKDNKFYNGSYLEDDYNFVASLIDYFKIDFNYLYTLSEKVDYKISYDVNALLEVYDSDNNSKPIEKSSFEIVPKTTLEGKGQVIKLELFNQNIEYQKYNQIVQNWRKEVSPEAVLNVVFNVSWSGKASGFEKPISDSYTSSLKIPISKKIITISKPNSLNEDNTISEAVKLPLGYKVILISTVGLFVASVLRLFIIILDINEDKDQFEQKINKILREFDRAVTEAKGSFKKNNKDHYIEVNDFYELMDVHDNLNVPIVFYRDSDSKCTFVVRDEKNVYYAEFKKEITKSKEVKKKKSVKSNVKK